MLSNENTFSYMCGYNNGVLTLMYSSERHHRLIIQFYSFTKLIINNIFSEFTNFEEGNVSLDPLLLEYGPSYIEIS